MSCNRNGLKIALGSARAGISAVGNRTAGVVATTAARLDRLNEAAGRTVAPATNLAMRFIGPQIPKPGEPWELRRRGDNDGRAFPGRATRVAPRGRAVGRRRQGRAAGCGLRLIRRFARPMWRPKPLKKGPAWWGVAAGHLTKTGEAGQVTGKTALPVRDGQIPVALWTSSLTPLLNRRDVLTRQVISSKG